MPQLIVIAVILSVFDEHVNDFLDPIKKHILKKISWMTNIQYLYEEGE